MKSLLHAGCVTGLDMFTTCRYELVWLVDAAFRTVDFIALPAECEDLRKTNLACANPVQPVEVAGYENRLPNNDHKFKTCL
jgi:hypothetical protein